MNRIPTRTKPPRIMQSLARGKVIDIEDLLVWTYMTQKADVVMDKGVGLFRAERAVEDTMVRSMTTDSAAMVANHMMGAGGASMMANALHPDAETIHERVLRMRVDLRVAIITHARTASVPNWGQGLKTQMKPVLTGRGEPKVVWDRNGNHQLYCPVQVVNHTAHIETLRHLYLIWWESIAALAHELRHDSALKMWLPMMPTRSPLPWQSAENVDMNPWVLTLRQKFGS